MGRGIDNINSCASDPSNGQPPINSESETWNIFIQQKRDYFCDTIDSIQDPYEKILAAQYVLSKFKEMIKKIESVEITHDCATLNNNDPEETEKVEEPNIIQKISSQTAEHRLMIKRRRESPISSLIATISQWVKDLFNSVFSDQPD